MPRLKSLPSKEDIAEIEEIKVKAYMKSGGDGLGKITAEVQEKHIVEAYLYNTSKCTLDVHEASNNYFG